MYRYVNWWDLENSTRGPLQILPCVTNKLRPVKPSLFTVINHVKLFSCSVPALSIQALYPFSSLSTCCCRRNFMKALLFSTLSLSLANSLKRAPRQQQSYSIIQSPVQKIFTYKLTSLPRQDSQNQVQDKKWANNDERDEVHPIPRNTQCIISLRFITYTLINI